MNILNQLTIKHLTLNKKRTIVTIVGVLLSTALMVGIGLLFSSIRDNSVKTVIESRGSQHVTINGVQEEKLDILKHNNKLDHISVVSLLGFSKIENPTNEGKPYLYVGSADKSFLETLQLKKGRLPHNSSEIVISNHMQEEWDLGDTVTIPLVKRVLNGKVLLNNAIYDDEEVTEPIRTEVYKVVGIVNRPYSEEYSAAGYSVFTTDATSSMHTASVYLHYKKVKTVYDTTKSLAKQLELQKNELGNYEQIQYNDSLLALSGVSRYDNLLSSLFSTIVIILTLISIGCIIVIYNSFSISVMERKKQFGLFSSIGATKKQLQKTVFFEAIIIGLIGIPLGILSGFIGIGIVVQIINQLLPDIFGIPLALTAYPLFLIVPIIFMIAVILISAFIPAKMASRITPIEAIRQNDDIKIKGNKVKTPKWIRTIFGIEGELALKNMKRNKKKYRVTIVSLFISIVLFVSFSGLLDYGITGAYRYSSLPDFDVSVTMFDLSEKSRKDWLTMIQSHKGTEKTAVYLDDYYGTLNMDLKEYYNDRFLQMYLDHNNLPKDMNFYYLDDDTYNSFLKELNLNTKKPILINRFRGITYGTNSRTSEDYKLFTSLPSTIEFCKSEYRTLSDGGYEEINNCGYTLNSFYVTDKYPIGLEQQLNNGHINVLLNREMAESFHFLDNQGARANTIYVQSSDADGLTKLIKEKIEQLPKNQTVNYNNVQEELKFAHNMVLVIKILLYGFITLVTLIGVTSVFNTINTSISLRRKEFAMLRSMGLTPNGFNRILYFESIFFGIKSLFYALPVSIGVIYLLGKSFGEILPRDGLLIPGKSILIAIVGVFLIILSSMMYASKKMKKENILNAIREENI